MRIFAILFLLSSTIVLGQCDQNIPPFQHYSFTSENDVIDYHVFDNGELSKAKNLLIYISGSSAKPMFSKVKRDNQMGYQTTIPINYNDIPVDFALVVISKSTLPFCTDDLNFKPTKSYYDNESLVFRAHRTAKVIDRLLNKSFIGAKRVVVLGHSEGSDVVAKLGTLTDKVTHLGFWSGSGNSQWYDFPLFIRKEVISGKVSEEEGLRKMDSLLMNYQKIMNDPNNLKKKWNGHSYKRWSGFSEPPINNLLKIDIPIFAAMGTKDKAVPIESFYLLPVEFIRKGKTNLTFKVYPYLDHNLNRIYEDGTVKSHWDKIFKEFLQWVLDQ